jgi:hypothetical protein
MINQNNVVNVTYQDSNSALECNGSYLNFVSDAARAFNLDPALFLSESIKIFYFDSSDWIRISSDEELAMSFTFKDPNTPIALRASENFNLESMDTVRSDERKQKKERKGRRARDDEGDDPTYVKKERKGRRARDNDGDDGGDDPSSVKKERKGRRARNDDGDDPNYVKKERKGRRARNDDEGDDPTLVEKRALEAEQRNNAVYVNADEITNWPENMTHLFVDGNNILYMTKTLRDNTLKRKLNRAQDIIVAATEFFAARTNGLKDVYVIFDNISTTYEKVLENGTNLFVKSARPDFSTTDDMLVDWSHQNKDTSPHSMHISSDRALCGRLNMEGAKVMKPKAFFTLTLKLTNQENETVDSWFSKVNENLA